jgi:hypothetical protein
MKKFGSAYILLLPLFFLFTTVHCKKIKEDLGMKFIIAAMTDGRWIVDKFTDNNEDIAALFAGYEFQFTGDGKVYGYYNGTQVKEGTWVGDVNDLTIYSNFPSAAEPLIRLNDTWKVTNNTTKLVEATPFNSTRTAYLKLVKKI